MFLIFKSANTFILSCNLKISNIFCSILFTVIWTVTILFEKHSNYFNQFSGIYCLSYFSIWSHWWLYSNPISILQYKLGILSSDSDFSEIDFDSILKLKTKEFSESFERMIVWHKRLFNCPARKASKNTLFRLDVWARGRDGGPVKGYLGIIRNMIISCCQRPICCLLFGTCELGHASTKCDPVLSHELISCDSTPVSWDSNPKTGRLLFKLLIAYVYCQIYSVIFLAYWLICLINFWVSTL